MQTRIAGYDFARSLALFGLMVPNVSPDVENITFTLYYVIKLRLHSLMQGGAVPAFLLLGGVGVSLLTQQVRLTNDVRRIADSRKRLIRRAAFLLLVGICCNLIWQTGFLGFYSIYIVIGALLLTVSNRWLWLLACMFVLISIIFTVLVHGYFDYYEAIRNQDVLRDTNPWTVKGIVFRLYLNGFGSSCSWAVFLLIGMWLGRQNVHHPRARRTMFFGGITVVLVAECALWLLVFGALWLPYSFYSVMAVPEQGIGTILILTRLVDFFARCGTAIAIIAGSLMLTEKHPDAKWTKPFIATGQLALTLYVLHLAIGMGLSKVLGGLENNAYLFAIGSAVMFCICAVIFSHFWRKRFERGPLEWGIRRITG